MPILTTSIQYSNGITILARAIKQNKVMKGIQIRKEEVKLSSFADDMNLHIENPKESVKKLLILTISVKWQYKINIQKSVAFLYTYDETSEKERKLSHLQ